MTDKRIRDTIDAMAEVSPTFCAAKWKQVTIHLQNGMTHSCHHPGTHKVPLAELAANPSALHNTQFKKEQRKLMLEGKRPSECDYCWRVEDSGTEALSDRTLKSNAQWAFPFIKDIAAKPWDDDVLPSYVEVSFSHVCNFKCTYCMPMVSSPWMEEIERFGPYPTTDAFNNLDWVKDQNMMPIPNREHNPYVDAFWKWWPELYPALKHFRITGGEPLMSRNTFKVMEWILENPHPDLEFSVNSNMGIPDALLDKFIEMAKRITGEGKLKAFRMFTSSEAHGAKAEYIRTGLDYNRWLDNIDRFLTEVPGSEFTIMSTFNALSVTSYKEFLDDMLALRLNHLDGSSRAPLLIDIPYLRYPSHQAAYILPATYMPTVIDTVTHMYKNRVVPEWDHISYRGFYQSECDTMRRVHDVIWAEHQNHPDPETRFRKERANFYRFFDEHDRRRDADFCKTFPEMSDFFHDCKRIAEIDGK
jgi:hypothetical protein